MYTPAIDSTDTVQTIVISDDQCKLILLRPPVINKKALPDKACALHMLVVRLNVDECQGRLIGEFKSSGCATKRI
ncbi:MAG: hypothetical protein ACJA13_002699 [Paraglaciecola sp.]|jgi:hypothetical protein